MNFWIVRLVRRRQARRQQESDFDGPNLNGPIRKQLRSLRSAFRKDDNRRYSVEKKSIREIHAADVLVSR